jgi:hypothetical protein
MCGAVYQRDMSQADQSTTGQVRDEEGHGRGIEDRTELASHCLHGLNRRLRRRCLEYPSDIDTAN